MTDVIKTVKGEVVASLEQNEETIRRGLATFIEVGQALAAIRDQRQYRELGYETFDDYCRDRWDFTRQNADDQIDAAMVVAILECKDPCHLPANPWVAKPLARVMRDQGEQAVVEVWEKITAGKAEDDKVTGADVRRCIKDPANYAKTASWHELIGIAGETLHRAEKQVGKLEGAINRKPSADFMEKAEDYAVLADEIAARLRSLGGDA